VQRSFDQVTFTYHGYLPILDFLLRPLETP